MPSFQPFSSGSGQSSHLNTPETTPLRKRENDSFSSPEAPLLWRHPLQPATGGLHSNSSRAATYSPSMAASSSHFGEVNFAHMSRRRGRYDNRHGSQFWIPWVMKAILASPIVVLVLWFIAVTLHHPTESTMKSNRYEATAKHNPRTLLQQQQNFMVSAAVQHQPHHQHSGPDKILPVYVPMGQGSNGQLQQPQFSPAAMQNNGLQMPAPQLISQAQSQRGYLMRESQPMVIGQEQTGFMPEQPQMMMMQPVQNNNMMLGHNMMQLSQQQPGQMYQQLQQPQQLQQQPQMMMMQGQQPQMMMMAQQEQLQIQQQQAQMIQEYENQQQPVLMASRGNHRQNLKPAHPAKWGNFLRGGRKAKTPKQTTPMEQSLQVVYYYDPAEVSVQDGQFQAPSVVYDLHGNEIELASLTSPYTEVFIEPPVVDQMASNAYGSSQSGSNGSIRRSLVVVTTNSTDSNFTAPFFPLPPPPLEMKITTPDSWGESSTQDQSIIVCTVAVMALLVGALSARRLRARSFLSSCIENESLEDEVAFDNAYTISGADSYNTFGWKGDLEKFDV